MIHAKKIVINQDGHLCIQREQDTNVHPVVCPFRPGHHYCGTWCPHLGDIEQTLAVLPDGKRQYSLGLSCGVGCVFFSEDVSPEPPETDHLAPLFDFMRPRIERCEGDEP